MSKSIYFVPFILFFNSFAGALDTCPVSASLPEFTEEETVIFAAGPDHPEVRVRSGDLALEMSTSIEIAFGSYPIPKTFANDVDRVDGGNWDLYRWILKKLRMPFSGYRPYLIGGLDLFYRTAVHSDLSDPDVKQASIPPQFRITAAKLAQMRGQFHPIHMDEFAEGTPEAEAHKKIKGWNKNYYRLIKLKPDMLKKDFNLEEFSNQLKSVAHYYPGTSFVTHVGIISVEIENGKKVPYVYDAAPYDEEDDKKVDKNGKDESYPTGYRKLAFSDFFSPEESSYGIVTRVKDAKPAQGVGAVKWAWKQYSDACADPTKADRFDGSLDWRQDKKFFCGSLVWRAYVHGASMNILSDLNMVLLPAWVTRHVSEEGLKLDFHMAPQSFLTSLYNQRIVDFELKPFQKQLEALAKHEVAPLPPVDARNPETGHRVYSTEFP